MGNLDNQAESPTKVGDGDASPVRMAPSPMHFSNTNDPNKMTQFVFSSDGGDNSRMKIRAEGG